MSDSEHDLAHIAEEAYLFGFPILLMETTRRMTVNVPAGARPGFGPMNAFTHMRAYPPGDFKEVVRPNFDTLYSILWFDVREEPVVVSVPDTHGRYYMLPFLDMWTDVFGLVGSRTTGTGPGHHALVTPDWSGELPAGVERIETPTPMGWVIGRTRTDGPADYEAVHVIQDGFLTSPLSCWPSPWTPAPVVVDEALDMQTPPLEQVLALSGAELLRELCDVMMLHPPHVVDQPILARMRRLGVQVGKPFDIDGLESGVAAAIESGAKAAVERMRRLMPVSYPVVDGWSQPTFSIGVYGIDYLRRAMIAMAGLGANRAEDAVYPVLYRDASGASPTGDADHVLHFAAEELPPADAFWSVTMYDGDGFPVPNGLDRYALGDRDSLVYNADGSLDIYVQHDDPGEERRANWLPSPRGPIGLTMRLYDPRPEALDGTWTPPPLMPS